MKRYLPIFAVVAVVLCGCKKDKIPNQNNSNNIKITLVSGNNQTADVGYPTQDSIVVKITQNGAPAANYDVQFIGSGCNEDLVTDLHTKSDGTVKYAWLMASNQGQQTLRAVAVNGNTRVDSVTVTATATAAIGVEPRSACIPNPGGIPRRILQLSTGRLITCFGVQTSIRYSDDNGQSWLPLKAFGADHTVVSIATTPQDELFAATETEGVFYSKDAGTTWTDITPTTFNKKDFIHI